MNSVNFPNVEIVEQHAAQWVAKIDRGLNPSEESELAHWLEDSPVHGEALVKCASMWDLLDVLSPIAKLMPIETFDVEKEQPLKTSPYSSVGWKRGSFVALAASILLSVGVVLTNSTAFLSPNGSDLAEQIAEVQSQTYKTEIGEMATFTLADGSTMQLNSDTQVTVSYSDSLRKLELVNGEAFFEVAKNKQKPFVVDVGVEQVTAVGTAFNIDTRSGLDTEVLVTEGKVKVNRNSNRSQQVYDDLFLTSGQSVKFAATNSRPQLNQVLDSGAALSWRDGVIVFQGESLAQVIREIDRYTPLTFAIVDDSVLNVSVGGVFKTGDTDQLLRVLEQNFGVHSTRLGDEILLHGSKN